MNYKTYFLVFLLIINSSLDLIPNEFKNYLNFVLVFTIILSTPKHKFKSYLLGFLSGAYCFIILNQETNLLGWGVTIITFLLVLSIWKKEALSQNIKQFFNKQGNKGVDEQFIEIFYGNSDKSENMPLRDFKSSEKAAQFLEKVAENIRKHGHGKNYRRSDDSIFKETEVENEN